MDLKQELEGMGRSGKGTPERSWPVCSLAREETVSAGIRIGFRSRKLAQSLRGLLKDAREIPGRMRRSWRQLLQCLKLA